MLTLVIIARSRIKDLKVTHYPMIDFGGDGPLFHFAVANGFPPQTYAQLLRPLTAAYHVVSLPPRPLWGEPPPETLIDWRDGTARDFLDGLHAHNLGDVIAVGHSLGGIASMLAVLHEPSRFKALILLDPTIMSRTLVAGLTGLAEAGMMDQIPFAVRALKRQRDFASTEAAYTYFKERTLFADWPDEVVQLYAQHGTQPKADGVTLAWTPEWEAYVFKTVFIPIWETLPRLRDLLPTLIVRGSVSDTYLPESAQEVGEMLPNAVHLEITGHGHLFPLTAPAETAEIVQQFLKDLA